MKWLIICAALLPLSGIANTVNNNQPGQQGYNPSTQRMQTEMQNQQSRQKYKMQQDQQRQSQDLQQRMQEQRNSATQRLQQSQPGTQPQQPQIQQNNNSTTP